MSLNVILRDRQFHENVIIFSFEDVDCDEDTEERMLVSLDSIASSSV